MLVLGAVACDARRDAPAPDDRAVFAFQSRWDTLDAFAASTDRSRLILTELVGAPLLRRDPVEGEVVPWLAEALPDLDDEGAVFTLRAEARWPDGRPVTARDAVATHEALRAHERPGTLAAAALRGVTDLEALDARRFRVRLATPGLGLALAFGRAFPILPDGVALDAAGRPQGAGPFAVESEDVDGLLLRRRRPWWGDAVPELADRYRLDRLTLRVVADEDALPRLLEAGAIEICVLPADAAPPSSAEVASFTSPAHSFVGWNVARPPFDAAEVRRALGASVPRARIAREALAGEATPLDGSFEAGTPTRPDLARVLAAASPGRPDDAPLLDFELLVPAGDIHWADAVVETWREALRQQGVVLRVERLELRALLDRLARGAFDAYLLVWTTDEGPEGFAPLVRAPREGVPAAPNFGGHRSPAIEAALTALEGARDPAARAAGGGRLADALRTEAPVSFLFRHRARLAWRPDRVTLRVAPHGLDWSALAAPPR